MRLWHQQLIHYLPSKQLIRQHQECCALRGNSWGKYDDHINYVFEHPYSWLFYYHHLVMLELKSRGHIILYDWFIENYRGKQLLYADPKDPFVDADFGSYFLQTKHKFDWWWASSLLDKTPTIVYPEHTDEYLLKCLDDLTDMRVELINGATANGLRLKLAIKGI